jgi:uncharacterized protein YdcH (DUF465 family)
MNTATTGWAKHSAHIDFDAIRFDEAVNQWVMYHEYRNRELDEYFNLMYSKVFDDYNTNIGSMQKTLDALQSGTVKAQQVVNDLLQLDRLITVIEGSSEPRAQRALDQMRQMQSGWSFYKQQLIKAIVEAA